MLYEDVGRVSGELPVQLTARSPDWSAAMYSIHSFIPIRLMIKTLSKRILTK